MITAIFLSTIMSSAQAQPAPADPIVVVGRRIEDAEAALKACLARNCPPDQDIAATLRLAELRIAAGDYKKARLALNASIRRNEDEARSYPIPLSDLYRAGGRVASHLGFSAEYYDRTWSIYRTVKNGLPEASSRHLFARMEVADMMGRTRGHERARLYYADIARDAHKAGRPDIAASAGLRSLLHHYPPGAARDEAIRKIADAADPRLRSAALDARLALTRIAYERNDLATAERLRKQFEPLGLEEPVLIYSPDYASVENEISTLVEFALPVPPPDSSGLSVIRDFPAARMSATKRLAGNFDDMWVDVGFRITGEGDVADVAILRSKGPTFWARPLLGSIRSRRYTPVGERAVDISRVERYTYTSFFERQTGTRLADRSPQGRVEYLSLEPGGLAAAD